MTTTKVVYSCVARGSTILASYQTAPTQNSTEAEAAVVLDLLLPDRRLKRHGRCTFQTPNYHFFCVVRKGLVYMSASNPESEKKTHYAFLSEVKKKFIECDLMEKVAEAKPHSLEALFRTSLSQLTLRHYNIGPSLAILESDLHEVKITIGQNFDKMMERGENLDYLTAKAKDLESAAGAFQETGNKLQERECCLLHRWKIALLVVALVVTVVVIVVVLWLAGPLREGPLPWAPPPPLPQIIPVAAGGNNE